MTRIPREVIASVLEFLLQIGEFEIESNKPRRTSKLRTRDVAPVHDTSALTPRGDVPDKTVQNTSSSREDTEDNGVQRTKRGAPESTPSSSRTAGVPELSKPNAKIDDDGLDDFEPLEALKELYRRKTREMPAAALLAAIQDNLAAQGVSLKTFVEEVRKRHAAGNWTNPAGLLRSLSKEFRSKTMAASPPLTAQAAADRDYKCPDCGSRKRGEGLIRGAEGFVPCRCASPEYIEQQQKRGALPGD